MTLHPLNCHEKFKTRLLSIKHSELLMKFLLSFVQNSRGAGKGKVHSFGKRDHAIKRNLNVPVVVRGWLYKQVSWASSALLSL